MLNFSIMRHYENWVIITLMLLIASIAVNFTAKIIIKKEE